MKIGDIDMHILPAGEDEDHLMLVMQGIEADLEAGGWDQPPMLLAMAQMEGGLVVAQVPLPEAIAENPAEMLPQFTQAAVEREDVRETLKKMLPSAGFVGIMFFCEGWSVPQPATDAPREEYEEWRRAAREGEFHLSPKRVEERIGTAMLTDGRFSSLMRARGETPRYHAHTRREMNMAIEKSRLPKVLYQLMWIFDALVPDGPADFEGIMNGLTGRKDPNE